MKRAVVGLLLVAALGAFGTGNQLPPHDPGLDLPIPTPVYQPPGSPPAPTAPLAPPPGPRAAPPVEPDLPEDLPPVIYGGEIDTESDSLIFVIDVSGSMAGARIERAKEELVRAISSIPASFRFNLIAYSCAYDVWSEPGMVYATEEARASAAGWVNTLVAVGGTGTAFAVGMALSERENLAVVLLTDGAPCCRAPDCTPAWHRAAIRAANTQGAVITVFGIGAYQETMRTFCQQVAADSGGSYFDVPQ